MKATMNVEPVGAFKMNGSGCVFEHYGRVPEDIYQTESFSDPLEESVFNNDVQKFKQLVAEGHEVSVRLKIGKMSCIEYAALRGYHEVLQALLDHSVHTNLLRQYFALTDIVERAYMLSKNKPAFFDGEALAEANRYEAALYTAIEYNNPRCVAVMIAYLGVDESGKHTFYTHDNAQAALTAKELAQLRGHTECFKLIEDELLRVTTTPSVQAC